MTNQTKKANSFNKDQEGQEQDGFSEEKNIGKILPENTGNTNPLILGLIQNFSEAGDVISYEEAEENFHNEVDFGEIDLSVNEHCLEEEMNMPEEKIKVVLVKPMQKPHIVEIGSDLKSMQLVVGGLIEEIMPYEEEVALVCNEEGKNIGLDLNRAIRNSDGEIYDIIAGDFFICSAAGENFTGLTDEQAQRYCEKFKNPECFFKTADGIESVPIILNKAKSYER